jgi:alkanesulfonate monooxygenase SsuD/methylene tetrahydromethanopterin reductase-like flavin-dependent oxidoreductase (luciferase family)
MVVESSPMLFGVALNLTARPGVDDAVTVRAHLALADLVESLGFDSAFVTEHHFSDYALTPSPIQILTYLSGRTRRILLGTAVVVVPWHHPIRLAEEMLLLDALSHGRAVFGVGRGSSPDEYAGLSVPAADSERLFTEGLTTVMDKLANTERPPVLRPRREPSSQIPFYTASATGACGRTAARLGLGLLLSGQVPPDTLRAQVNAYHTAVAAEGTSCPPPILLILATSRPHGQDAVDIAAHYLEADWALVDRHYRYTRARVSATPGYQAHRVVEEEFIALAADPELRRRTIMGLVAGQAIGSAAECVNKVMELCSVTGARHLIFEFGYGGMPIDVVQENMIDFAEVVLPMLRRRLADATT